jgi:LPS-assembly lipoprotein
MSSFKITYLIVLTLSMTACGFRPLYAPPSENAGIQGVYAFDELRRVAISNIPDREGQYLRNALVRLLHPNGRRGKTLYILNISLTEGTSSLAIQRSAEATRTNLTVSGSFNLKSLIAGDQLHSDVVTSTSGYNIFQSEFQTLMAEKGARKRALDDLAQQIRMRLASYLINSHSEVLRQ